MVKYTQLNVNFKNKKTCDCVQRALVSATGLDYRVIAKLQFDKWMATGYELGDKKNYGAVLEDLGFTKHPMPKYEVEGKKKRYMVGEIDKLVNKGNAFISLANHCVAYTEQGIVDLWDSRWKSISNYWTR